MGQIFFHFKVSSAKQSFRCYKVDGRCSGSLLSGTQNFRVGTLRSGRRRGDGLKADMGCFRFIIQAALDPLPT